MIKSIALLPSILACSFLTLAILLSVFEIDYNSIEFFNVLTINKKEDTQSIFSFTIGGIFTLTVFSYTMVMNVLNRNINNYSPRLIPVLLSERHHQVILGFTSGTIIYCLAMSIAINNSQDTYFPQIAGSLAIIFAMICILLFIYFLHSVSQSIHINHILETVYERGKDAIIKSAEELQDFTGYTGQQNLEHHLYLNRVGHLQSYDPTKINALATKYDQVLRVNHIAGDFMNTSNVLLSSTKAIHRDLEKELKRSMTVVMDVPMNCAETSFKHLVEVAIKASSPAINDPGTSITCINYLTALFLIRLQYDYTNEWLVHNSGSTQIKIVTNPTLLYYCYMEMIQYMKDDFMVSKVIANSLRTLQNTNKVVLHKDLERYLTQVDEAGI